MGVGIFPILIGVRKRVVSKRVVLADVPRYPNGNEGGYIRMFPGTENRNEGTFGCCLVPKSGMRVHSPQPPFFETAICEYKDRPVQKILGKALDFG